MALLRELIKETQRRNLIKNSRRGVAKRKYREVFSLLRNLIYEYKCNSKGKLTAFRYGKGDVWKKIFIKDDTIWFHYTNTKETRYGSLADLLKANLMRVLQEEHWESKRNSYLMNMQTKDYTYA
mgnify:CR=1 FL=1